MKRKYAIYGLILFGLVAILAISMPSDAAEIKVPDDYPTIQQAIDNASNGDIIKVNTTAEPYRENIVVNKEISLVGDPVIDAMGGIGIKIEANNTLVENFTIFNGSIGIQVYNASFTIVNVTINNCTIYNCEYGIEFYEVNESLINNTQLNNTSCGIGLSSSNYNTITNNNVSNNSDGISLSSSWDNNITNNIVSNNSWYGIYLVFSDYNNITNNNVVSNNDDGISLSSSNYNTITNNIVSDNRWYGIRLSSSNNNNITNNNVVSNNDDGISLSSSNYNTITNNIVSDNRWYGIRLSSSNNNNITNNNVVSNNDDGISLASSNNNNITNNNVVSNNDDGISLASSNNNNITNNTASANSYGIYLEYSWDNNITNNIASDNSWDGIYLSHSNYNNITNNIVSNNKDYGIYLSHSNNNNITNNIVSNNSNGIRLYSSDYNNIINNNVWNNDNYGIHLLSYSNHNNISYCNFSSNGEWDLYVSGTDNEIFFCQFSSYPTNVTVLGYNGAFGLKGVVTPPADPSGWRNISKYINATGTSWLNLSIYYENEEGDYSEMWKYNVNWYKENWYESKGINTDENYVWANITSFSIFAPLLDLPPGTTKEIGEPKYGTNDEWVTSLTPIWLNATDGESGSGVNATYYRIYFNGQWHPANANDEYCGNSNITEIDGTYWYIYFLNGSINFGPIHFHEECEHIIEYYSVDNATNKETLHNQTHYVDNTPPTTTKTYGTPYYTDGTNEWITSSTLITLSANDGGTCTCGVKATYYRIWHNGSWSNWNTYTSPFTLSEECLHYIEYYSEDNLGNVENVHNQTVYVDNTPPVTTKEFEGPKYSDHITSQTTIWVNSTDDGLCPVGSVHLNVKVYNATGEIPQLIYNLWDNVTSGTASINFTIPEECEHWINITAIDNLGNTAWHNETVYVDNSSPNATVDEITPYCQIVNEENPITINVTVIDSPGCAVGVANVTLYYRFSRYNSSFSPWIELETLNNSPWQWSFNASNGSGYYQFYAVAYDLLGNHEPLPNETTLPEAILCVKYVHTYTLYPKWNMLTIPVKNESITNAKELGNFLNSQGCNVTVIVRFNASIQRYESWVAEIPDKNNFEIVSGMGYWIFTQLTEQKNFSIEGRLIEEIDVSLYVGYNLIGWANIENTNASTLGSNISNCTKVGRWRAWNQTWAPEHIVGHPPGDFDISIGDAVFIFRNKGGVIAWDGGRSFLQPPY
ncbi:MAG: right-handed parallel beta-helix repeat-containing protein [Thermoplasmatales archaeon]|nr:right-handed parallel beta-helix repeat-containing protein [Thermoplasmatales archaeon]